MPQPPNVEGLPLWLQAMITLAFGGATLLVALRGYMHKPKPEQPIAGPQIAHLADMGAVRHLSDINYALNGSVVSLERSIGELTHFVRENTDVQREVCQRLRELRDRLDRSGL